MSKARFHAMATVLALAMTVPTTVGAADVELTQAWAGLSRSFDARTKTKQFGPMDLVVLVEGKLAAEDRSIVCTTRVFDGKDSNGLPRRRSGVKVSFQGEIIDALTGETVEVLKRRSKKTNAHGDATIELKIDAQTDFYAVVQGKMKKKKTTGAFVTCTAAKAGTSAALSTFSKSASEPPTVDGEVSYSGLTAGVVGDEANTEEPIRSPVVRVEANLVERAQLTLRKGEVSLELLNMSGAPIPNRHSFVDVALYSPTGYFLQLLPGVVGFSTDENGRASLDFTEELRDYAFEESGKPRLGHIEVHLAITSEATAFGPPEVLRVDARIEARAP